MRRDEMINTIGSSYFTPNTETGEFSYPKAFKEAGLTFNPIKNDKDRKFEKLDLRFEKDGVTVLIETKQNFTQADEAQLSAYVEYEKELTHNKIVAILANTNNDDIKVWRGVVSDSDYLEKEVKLKSMDEYVDLYTPKINDKEKVMQNTYKLNKLLQKKGINPFLRSRFVSTCLLAIKNGLVYNTPDLSSAQITTGIKEILEKLLNNDIKKAEKLVSLNRSVLEHQKIRNLSISDYRIILDFIEKNILPFINDRSTSGQDLLNLFFIAFNKYVGRSNKNQAFTPDHITDFMSKICGVNKNSVVLDPCCGSGAFLVRAMTQALDDCSTKTEQDKVKKEQIFGIEFEEDIYGLVATNMLIHSDGNSNIIKGNCFDYKEWIQTARPNVILMNPPYNASTDNMQKPYIDTWGESSSDPSKGLYFVKYILDTLNEIHCSAKLAVLLPVACAIGTDNEIILNLKKEILKENTLDAVFTLPNDIFYPGASASVCCMVFKVGIKHTDISNPDTFFGYYKDDGFKKKKNLGRVEQIDITTGKSKWVEIEKKWIETYRNRKVLDGLSAVHKVTGDDEWLCEAYMKTDFTKLSEADFQQTLNNYLAYMIKEGKTYES